MRIPGAIILSLAVLTFSPAGFGADTSACMDCHDDDEFTGISAADIVAAARDTGIPPHKRFTDVSDDDLQAIAAELAGN